MAVELKNVLKIEDPTGFVYYLGTFTPMDIKQLTFVPVVIKSSVDDELWLNEIPGGYQRAGDPSRMKRIKEFVIKRENCLIPPVLISARGGWKFSPSSSNKSFGIIQAENLAAIIDGQHRLGGLWRLAKDSEADEVLKKRPIPFMAICEMSIDQEKQEFVDINDNQKGVKKSLLRYLDREENFAGMAASALMEDEESVFKGRIDIQKKEDWQIILFGAVQDCIDLMFSKDFTITKKFDPHKDASIRESSLEFVLEYWRKVKECLPELWSDMDKIPQVGQKKSKEYPGTSGFEFRLLEETGIRAFSKLASELFTLTWIEGIRQPSWDAIQKYLEDLGKREKVKLVLTKPKFNEEVLKLDHDLKSSGKAGVDAIYRHINSELLKVVQGL